MAWRSLAGLIVLNLAGLAIAAGLFALGTWQVQRRAWKLDLIARVEAHVHADPVAAPGPAEWPTATANGDEYRRVRVTGRFLRDRTTFVQAVTALGPGFWTMTPLRSEGGFVVLINRGFVPPGIRASADAAPPAEPVTVIGVLRTTEPGGGFLRSNDPGADLWYSRDVAAIGAAKGLVVAPRDRDAGDLAPYFIDAEAGPDRGYPKGGLTVLRFANNHLVYAVTWFVLALMVLGGLAYLDRDVWRRRRGA